MATRDVDPADISLPSSPEAETDPRKLKELEDEPTQSEMEDDSITAYGMYQGLVKAWRNELFSPEILAYKGDYVECMLEVIKALEENLKGSAVPEIVRSLHQLELERVRYVLSAYLRQRLDKIEKYAEYSLTEDVEKLSGEEQEFTRDFIHNMDTLFDNLALRHMPPNLRTLDKEKAKTTPNLDEFVFARAKEDVGEVPLEEDTITVEKGSIHILRYSEIRSLVEKGKMELI